MTWKTWHKKLLILKQKYIDSRCSWLISEDYTAKMDSKFLAIDIDALEANIKDKVSSTIGETIRYIEKDMGFKLDLKKINVIEFFGYINDLTNTKQA